MAMVLRYVHSSDEHIDAAMAAIDTGPFDKITPKLHSLGANASFKSSNIVPVSAKKA